jgi:hypothetical protein
MMFMRQEKVEINSFFLVILAKMALRTLKKVLLSRLGTLTYLPLNGQAYQSLE